METTLAPSPIISKTVKALKLVDYNNKKSCNCMLEINLAPAGGIPESKLKSTVFQVTWEDGSQGEYVLEDLIRLELFEITSIHSWNSHGMDAFEYVKWIMEKFPELKKESKMAVYFYRKLPSV